MGRGLVCELCAFEALKGQHHHFKVKTLRVGLATFRSRGNGWMRRDLGASGVAASWGPG